MRKSVVAAVLAAAASCSIHDQRSGFGLGIMVGGPTGGSWKVWTGGDHTLAGGVAWSFSDNGHVHLHADHLFHKVDPIPGTVFAFDGITLFPDRGERVDDRAHGKSISYFR